MWVHFGARVKAYVKRFLALSSDEYSKLTKEAKRERVKLVLGIAIDLMRNREKIG